MGRTKAAVLPLPVIAQARTSRPSRAGGIASFWIGVGSVNPIRAMPRSRSGWRSNEVNDMSIAFFEAQLGPFSLPSEDSWHAQPRGRGGRETRSEEDAGLATKPALEPDARQCTQSRAGWREILRWRDVPPLPPAKASSEGRQRGVITTLTRDSGRS